MRKFAYTQSERDRDLLSGMFYETTEFCAN